MNNNRDKRPAADILGTAKERHDRDLIRQLDPHIDQLPQILGITDHHGINAHPDRAVFVIADSAWPYITVGGAYKQCIPYTELGDCVGTPTEYYLGTDQTPEDFTQL